MLVVTMDRASVGERGGDPDCLHCVIYTYVVDLIEGGRIGAADGVLRVAEALGTLVANFDEPERAEMLHAVEAMVAEKSEEPPGPRPVYGHA